jgi:hypothetical protein
MPSAYIIGVFFSLNVLPLSPAEPVFSLYLLIPAMRKQNPQNPSEKRHPPLKLDFVRVGGRYRVGKLLGSGRSGEPPTLFF